MNLIVKVTNNCNLKCSYCYDAEERKNKITYIDKEKIVKLSNIILEEHENLEITFHGGEPTLLNKEYFIFIIDELKNKNVEFKIQSNGVLMDKDLIDFFEENKIKVGLSYDFVNENIKRGTSEEINKQIKSNLLNYNIGAISVIDIKDSDKLIETTLKNKEHKMCFNIEYLINKKKEEIDILIKNYKDFFDFTLFSDLEYLEKNLEKKINLILGGDLICNLTKCLGKFIILNSNGEITFCDRFGGNNKETNLIHVDKVKKYEDIFLNNKFEEILNEDFNFYNKNCQNCEVNYFCKGQCLADRYYEKGIKEKNENVCYFRKEIIKYIFNKLFNLTFEELLKINNVIFKKLFDSKFIFNFMYEE